MSPLARAGARSKTEDAALRRLSTQPQDVEKILKEADTNQDGLPLGVQGS